MLLLKQTVNNSQNNILLLLFFRSPHRSVSKQDHVDWISASAQIRPHKCVNVGII